MIDNMTRRTFFAASASTIAALAGTSVAHSPTAPSGPVYGRTGPRGIAPGTASRPSRGEVALLDGRVIEALHVTSRGIGARKSVFLVPEAGGAWSVLYAEC